MKNFLKNLLHVVAIAAASTIAHQLTSGVPITAGNILWPGLVAGGAAAVGAIVKNGEAKP